jgi:hypothetical protein
MSFDLSPEDSGSVRVFNLDDSDALKRRKLEAFLLERLRASMMKMLADLGAEYMIDVAMEKAKVACRPWLEENIAAAIAFQHDDAPNVLH